MNMDGKSCSVNGFIWLYAATTANESMAGDRIVIRASDKPGNIMVRQAHPDGSGQVPDGSGFDKLTTSCRFEKQRSKGAEEQRRKVKKV